MRGEVRAKERGVWRRLTNRLYAGNGTNHGYSSGLCCSLFISLFSYISVLFTSLFLITLSSTLTPSVHCCLPHESCGWASHTSLSLTPTSILTGTSLQFPLQSHLGVFSLLHRTLPSPWFLFHCPPCFTQFTPLRQIIMLSVVTKEMHTPSITMYKFSARGFGRVLIKKPFHSFS